jgi:hypothetical protein
MPDLLLSLTVAIMAVGMVLNAIVVGRLLKAVAAHQKMLVLIMVTMR